MCDFAQFDIAIFAGRQLEPRILNCSTMTGWHASNIVLVKSEVGLNDAAMCHNNNECYGFVSNLFLSSSSFVLPLKPSSSVVIPARKGFCKCDEILNLLDEL